MSEVLQETIPRKRNHGGLEKAGSIVLRGSSVLLVATVWLSALLFGLYILAFYAAALYQGDVERWNLVLPRLYERETPAANVGIGIHFATGGIILVLGCIQLLEFVRKRFPVFHRWVGRLYVLASVLAALGGLVFIFIRGTIGGTVMDIGFGLYGVLMFVAAVQTFRYAVARKLEEHRAWALRLFALAIGSWLYRMEVGFWLILGGPGHTPYFEGPFDKIMSFFFYLPNLLVVEIFLRVRDDKAPAFLKFSGSVVFLLATGVLLLGTYYFTRFYWWPAISQWLFG